MDRIQKIDWGHFDTSFKKPFPRWGLLLDKIVKPFGFTVVRHIECKTGEISYGVQKRYDEEMGKL